MCPHIPCCFLKYSLTHKKPVFIWKHQQKFALQLFAKYSSNKKECICKYTFLELILQITSWLVERFGGLKSETYLDSDEQGHAMTPYLEESLFRKWKDCIHSCSNYLPLWINCLNYFWWSNRTVNSNSN